MEYLNLIKDVYLSVGVLRRLVRFRFNVGSYFTVPLYACRRIASEIDVSANIGWLVTNRARDPARAAVYGPSSLGAPYMTVCRNLTDDCRHI